ncbi:hypothetical protein PYW08_007915 [Mythimna loreyi]|uniref:Uncharacterized protein n=1 Tax=Mythimna loreyi TaxID=667449 RepID=A0ACC2QF37_9NEOP|nr:hypothetical protein PYW08_007915 [Mythimna loreyi]
MNTLIALASALYACTALASPPSQDARCHEGPDVVSLQTDKGLVCGLWRVADNGERYASFRGVPYAKQPVGELRFKELVPAEPWDVLNATHEGPICLQTEVLYGRLMNKSQVQSEACIYANIHLPADALAGARLPILVFIHGGGFAFGSGDADLHGPEYLVSKKVIVITFNYRLNVFGFLSMNTEQIPGNAGLRDQVTLLNWVQRNAKYFGGDPDKVTIAGQSAGAVSAHLLTLSRATQGLFKGAILMSGTAASTFYSSSPAYAQVMSKSLLQILGINSTDPDYIHRQLIDLPAKDLREANKKLLDIGGLVTFVPTVESSFPGVTPIIDADPETLIVNGRGKDIPLLVGFTTAECETFRKRLVEFDLARKIQNQSFLKVPPKIFFMTPPHVLTDLINKIDTKYYKGAKNLDNFVKICSDGLYEYSALQLVQQRAKTGGSPVFLYRFAYEGRSNVIEEATGLKYDGVGHIEDLTYVFKPNAALNVPGATPPSEDDINMKNLMTEFIVNFMNCSKPYLPSIWPASNGHQFEDIRSPMVIESKEFSVRQHDIIAFIASLTTSTEQTGTGRSRPSAFRDTTHGGRDRTEIRRQKSPCSL